MCEVNRLHVRGDSRKGGRCSCGGGGVCGLERSLRLEGHAENNASMVAGQPILDDTSFTIVPPAGIEQLRIKG